VTARKKQALSGGKGSCVQQKYTVDWVKVPMEPTPVEELNKAAVLAVHCVLRPVSVRDCC